MATRAAVVGFVLALAAILFHANGFGYDEVRRPAVALAAALALAGGAASARGASWGLRASDLALLAVAASAFFAVNLTAAMAALFPALAAWIFLRATALGWIPRSFMERRGLQVLGAVGVLFSGYGLLQVAGADVLGFARDTKLAVSTIGNTNYAGVLSAALALAGLAAALFEAGLPRRLTGAAAAVLGGLHVAASGSLAGLVGLAAGVVAFALLLVRRHGMKPASFFPLLVLVLALVPVAGRVTDRVASIARGEDRTSRVRLGLWKGTLRLAADYPVFGCGVGNFRAAFPPYRDAGERRLSHEGLGIEYVEANDPHNSYLAILAESGPVALIAILGVLVLAVVSGIRRAREPDPASAGLAFAGTAGLVALAVSGEFNSLSGHLPFAVLAGVLAGWAAPVEAQDRAPAWSRASQVVAAFLLAIAPIPWLLADIHFRAAMYTTNQAGERIDSLRKALDVLPGHWPARFQIAMTWRALGEGEGTVRAELREVLKVHPHNVSALIELASGSPAVEEAELLRRAEKIAPEYVVLNTRLVGVDLRNRDIASARRRLERILEVLPEEPEALYTIGRTWLMERKPEEAITWLKRAIAKNPKLRERLSEDHPELSRDPRFSELLGP